MVKVYDMASGDLLSDSTQPTCKANQAEAAYTWSAPGSATDREAQSSHGFRDVPELALQLIEVR